MRTVLASFVPFVFVVAATSQAAIDGSNEISIDFTKAADAAAKATWSEPNQITVTQDGLGRDGDAASERDGWIQTKPVALGLSWRPTYGAHVRVTVRPPRREVTLANGQKFTPDAGAVYARYSPDLKHWSSWQSLQRGQPQSREEKENVGVSFSGQLRVPERERHEYTELFAQYAKLDVPWKSDEEAAVRWILQRDPDFFAKQLPFIGYVEILYETGFYGGQRIQSVKAEISWGVGGMNAPPRDELARAGRDDLPWRFVAPDAERPDPRTPADQSPRTPADRQPRDR